MNHLRVAAVYTLLVLALGVVSGIIFSIVERLVGVDDQWGVLDVSSAVQLVTTLAIAFCVFAVLHKRQLADYYTVGGLVVLMTVVLQVAAAYFVAPQSAREGYNWPIAVLVPVVLNAAALAIVGLFHHLRRSSSNTSLERTREG